VVAYAPGVTQGANIDRLISNRQAFHLVVDAAEGRLPPEKFFARLNELTADEALADDGVDNIGFIRDGRKLIRFRNHEFLFDLRADPAERVNLIAQQADLVRQLKARIAALNAEQRRQFREFVRREGPAMDALSRRQLKELGYIVP
jgi:hypothetical protein